MSFVARSETERNGLAWHDTHGRYVQTVASSFCMETHHVNESNATSPVYCPTWAGGVGNSSTQPAPVGRFPSFGGDGMTPTNDPDQFNEGWINVPHLHVGPTSSSLTVDLSGALPDGAVPTAIRYAWGVTDCCDLRDPATYTHHGCIANCPIIGSNSRLPANPFMAKIVDGKCECVAPQVCGGSASTKT